VKTKTATPKGRFLQRVDALVAKEQWDEVEKECAAFLESDETCKEAFFLRALAAVFRNDFAAALDYAGQAYEDDPGVTEFCDLLATIHGLAGDLNNAAFFAKMASVGQSSPQLAGWRPKSLPTFTEAFFEARTRPFLQRAQAALAHGLWRDAEHWYGQHLAFHPRDAEGYVGLANCLMIQGFYGTAVEHLRSARHAVPEDARVTSLLGSALAALGQFAESRSVHRTAKAASADNVAIHAAAIGDLLMDPAVEPAAVAAATLDWAERFAVTPDAVPARRSAAASRRLTVGYVIGGMPRTGQSRALADILNRHDTQRFRVVGFGAGELSDSFNVVFQKCCEAWTDTRDVDPLTFASMVLAEGVDILVDVSALQSPTLFRTLGARVAPVQAVWSPVLYGSASLRVDALLTDGFLDPADRPTAVAGEGLARLTMGSPIVERTSPDVAAAGADGRGPVFAADATLAEINVPTAEAWARILAAVPDAVLLLADHDFRNDEASRRLIGLFGNFGLAHRIDVVSVKGPAELFAQADVCLLPYQSLRPEVAVEALAVGVPAVNWSGVGRHRRLVGSVLHFAGLADDLVAESAEAYVGKAVAWMADAARRGAFRASAREHLAKSPLFDAAGRAADLERTYLELHRAVAAEPHPA